MWSLLFYVKADQGTWEHCHCVHQVLKPLFDVKERLVGNVADVAVQCKREPAVLAEQRWSKEYSDHWVDVCYLWKGTRRFHLARAPSIASLVDAPAIRVEDMAHGDAIAQYLEWALDEVPPERKTVLVFWGHGGAFLVPYLQVVLIMWEGVRKLMGSLGMPDAFTRQAPMADGVKPRTDLHALPQFARGLKRGLQARGRTQVDVLAFNSCFMACVEVAYELRALAKVMVASEESTPFEQWRHREWTVELAEDPNATAETVGCSMVRTYQASTRVDATISAIRLADIEALAEAIREFVALARSKDKSGNAALWQCLREARESTGEYGRYGGALDVLTVDIVEWFDKVQSRCTDAAVVAAAAAVTRACRQSIVCADAAPQRRANYGSHGLAIFFPKTREEFARLALSDRYQTTGKEAPAFVKATHWREFLDVYWS